jgi:hypothetical protein
MYSQKIIWSWVLFIAALLVYGILESYESRMMSLFIFGVVIGVLRKDIERERIDRDSFSYFWDLSSIVRSIIVGYLLVVTVLLLWLSLKQPETLETLFYGDRELFMLFLVLLPIILPLFWNVIKYDLRVIRDEQT